MDTFKTGDKVVCVNDTDVTESLIKGMTYVIQKYDGKNSPPNVVINGQYFYETRFQLVPEIPPPVYKYFYINTPLSVDLAVKARSADYDSLELLKADVNFKRHLIQSCETVTIHRSEQIGEADFCIKLNIKE